MRRGRSDRQARDRAAAPREHARARCQRRSARRDHGAGHFSRQPSASAAAPAQPGRSRPAPAPCDRAGARVRARRAARRGTPPSDTAAPARLTASARRLLHQRVGGDAGRQRAVTHAIDHRGHRVARPHRPAARRSTALLLRRSSSRLPSTSRCGAIVAIVRLLDAVAAERVEQAARVARLQPVLPAQRLQRGVAHGGADDLAELHVRAGRRQRRRRRDLDRRRDAELVGAGAGRQVARRAARAPPAAAAPRSCASVIVTTAAPARRRVSGG